MPRTKSSPTGSRHLWSGLYSWISRLGVTLMGIQLWVEQGIVVLTNPMGTSDHGSLG